MAAGAHIYYIRLACSRDVSSIEKVAGEKYFRFSLSSTALFLSICRPGCRDMIIFEEHVAKEKSFLDVSRATQRMENTSPSRLVIMAVVHLPN